MGYLRCSSVSPKYGLQRLLKPLPTSTPPCMSMSHVGRDDAASQARLTDPCPLRTKAPYLHRSQMGVSSNFMFGTLLLFLLPAYIVHGATGAKLYDVLGVPRSANEAEIKAAHRKLAKRYKLSARQLYSSQVFTNIHLTLDGIQTKIETIKKLLLRNSNKYKK